MGEVYRADDLKLRQPVALKFLPETPSKDTRRVERFHHEVRVARQVSHPNVCRVYDIGEADGQQFISMEYVDGEDLASVLRRMGRPSKDKAIQIARQLCAGLAAAHDKGVLHRDLKPHNVMIDERGKVRITDFGLAGFAEEFTGGEVSTGTPAYMAPEQLAGREASVKSDLYALGLILFELFASQRAFDGSTRQEIQRAQDATPRSSLSGIVDDVDLAVERVVLRCLETQPSARPSSALAVAAALPGGDPFAAALESGETPDPAVVAAAGEVGGLRPAIAVPCLLGVLAGLAAAAWLNESTALFRQVPLPKTPQALADRAGEIVKRLGHSDPVVDTAYGFGENDDYLRYIEENDDSSARWDHLADGLPPAMYFWYRQSPRVLIPPPVQDRVSLEQPPLEISGMARVLLDPEGRLLELTVVPPEKREPQGLSGAAPPAEWSVLFEEARLDPDAFRPAEPSWNPPVYCLELAAWEGTYSSQTHIPIRVEAGACQGKPVYFRIIGPWSRSYRTGSVSTRLDRRIRDYVMFPLVLLVLAGSLALAIRNLKLRRGDRAGALRFSVVLLVALTCRWLLGTKHVPDPWDEFGRFTTHTGWSMFFAALLWVAYVALEPYVRRHWPQTLVSWTRVLAGRFRDPLVGRDIVVGALFGVGMGLIPHLKAVALGLLGPYPPTPSDIIPETLLGGRQLAAFLLAPWFVWFALFHLFLLFLLRVLLRKQWIATLVFVMILTTSRSVDVALDYEAVALYSCVLLAALWVIALVVLLTRFGLLAAVVSFFFFGKLWRAPIKLDLSAWYSTNSLLIMLVLAGVASYGFWISLAGRPLLKDELLES